VRVPLPARTKRRLQLLFDRRRRLEAACRAAADDLCLAVHQASEAGATRSEIASLLGVGVSTVQGWVERGRRVEQEQTTSQ
jgi:transposase